MAAIGFIYGWSVFSAPLAQEFGWEPTVLSFTFTVLMWAFCAGGIVGAKAGGPHVGPHDACHARRPACSWPLCFRRCSLRQDTPWLLYAGLRRFGRLQRGHGLHGHHGRERGLVPRHRRGWPRARCFCATARPRWCWDPWLPGCSPPWAGGRPTSCWPPLWRWWWSWPPSRCAGRRAPRPLPCPGPKLLPEGARPRRQAPIATRRACWPPRRSGRMPDGCSWQAASGWDS